ncbi:GntR family transcriptional regulator [Sphingobium scionense]
MPTWPWLHRAADRHADAAPLDPAAQGTGADRAGQSPLHADRPWPDPRDRTRWLLPGEFLPSSRELAAALEVNRKTIVTAYEELIAQGWLVSAGTRGTIVSTSLPSSDDAPAPPIAPDTRQPDETEYPFLAAPDRLIAIPAGKWRKLDEGVADGRLFPADLLARAYRKAAEGRRAPMRSTIVIRAGRHDCGRRSPACCGASAG